MGDIYRSPTGADKVRAWCDERLAGRSRERLDTVLGETALTTVGEGDATVLYLPGTNFNAATSLTFLEACAAAGLRAVCADLPGQPGSSAGERVSDESRYAAWVGEVLRHLRDTGAGPLHLAGHSRGAAVALIAAPELVDGLVLVSPAGLVDVRLSWPILRATVPWLVRKDDRASARLARLMAGPELPYDEALVAWLTVVARWTHTTGAPSHHDADVLHRWRGHRVAVVVGEHDCFFAPTAIAGPARDALGVELTVVPRAGHLLVDQATETVVTPLVRFSSP